MPRQSRRNVEARRSGVDVDMVNLGTGGSYAATTWTCDLGTEYLKINADYRT